MFLRLNGYHRPHDLSEALELLSGPRVGLLAGGTAAVGPTDDTTEALVDLSGLGLRYIRSTETVVAIGAMTTLADLANDGVVAGLGSGVLCDAARRVGPPTLLQRATVGGALAGNAHAGELTAVLLALDAWVNTLRKSTAPAGPTSVREGRDLRAFLRQYPKALRKSLIEEIQIPVAPVIAALERVGRTPRDESTVSVAVAVQCDGAVCRVARIAASGLAPQPMRLPDAEVALLGGSLTDEQIQRAATAAARAVEPQSDLRGSAEYRRHLAGVLVRRALGQARTRAFAGGEE